MVIHKIRRSSSNNRFAFSECNKALHITGGIGTIDDNEVTCKNCLKKLEKSEGKDEL